MFGLNVELQDLILEGQEAQGEDNIPPPRAAPVEKRDQVTHYVARFM